LLKTFFQAIFRTQLADSNNEEFYFDKFYAKREGFI